VSSLTSLLMSSQFLLIVLLPAAAVLVSLVVWKGSEKKFALLAAGLWLEAIGFFALSFPSFRSYEVGQISGFGMSEFSSFLSSLGVLGHVLVVVALAILAFSKIRGKPSVANESK